MLERCPGLRVLLLNESNVLEDKGTIDLKQYPKVVFRTLSLKGYVTDWIDHVEKRRCLWDISEEEIKSRAALNTSKSE